MSQHGLVFDMERASTEENMMAELQGLCERGSEVIQSYKRSVSYCCTSTRAAAVAHLLRPINPSEACLEACN